MSSAPVKVSLGRFADTTSVSLPPRKGSVSVEIPVDKSTAPWAAEVRATRRTLVCPARSPA